MLSRVSLALIAAVLYESLLRCQSWWPLAWDGTDLVRKRRQGDAKPVVQHGFHASRHLEGEVLQERSEEEEKLHLGQALAETEPLAWSGRREQVNSVNKYTKVKCVFPFQHLLKFSHHSVRNTSGRQQPEHFPLTVCTFKDLLCIVFVVQEVKTTRMCCSSPAEKGRKAALFLNFPSSVRKCPGLKVCGVSHSFLSKRTEVKLGIIVIPWWFKEQT